jgi:8-oxo-dGTP pyrophosphatase MutT (NUDIX family)
MRPPSVPMGTGSAPYNAGMTPPERNPWRRVSRRTVYENPWIEIHHDDVIRPDGQPGIYGVVHFRHYATGVVPLDTATDLVLLVGQWRYALDRYSWEIPEGGADFDEDPEEAARRELAEETGYTGGTWRLLCEADLSNSVSDEVAYAYVATDLVPGTAAPEPTEQLQMRWVPFDETLAMIERGEIRDALTIMPLLTLARERAAR